MTKTQWFVIGFVLGCGGGVAAVVAQATHRQNAVEIRADSAQAAALEAQGISDSLRAVQRADSIQKAAVIDSLVRVADAAGRRAAAAETRRREVGRTLDSLISGQPQVQAAVESEREQWRIQVAAMRTDRDAQKARGDTLAVQLGLANAGWAAERLTNMKLNAALAARTQAMEVYKRAAHPSWAMKLVRDPKEKAIWGVVLVATWEVLIEPHLRRPQSSYNPG